MVMSAEPAESALDVTAAILGAGATTQPPEQEPAPDLRVPDQVEVEVAGDAPETESAPTAEATPLDLNKLLDELPDEEFEKLSRVSRKAESARRQAEQAEQRKIADANAQWAQRQEYASEIVAAAQVDDETGAIKWDGQKLQGTIARMFGLQSQAVMSGIYEVVKEETAGHSFSQDDVTRWNDAALAFSADPTKAGPLVKEWIGTIRKAAVAQATPELRKQIEREVRAEIAAKAKTEATRQADETRTQEPAPTRVSGRQGGGVWRSQNQIDTAFARDEISAGEFQRLRGSGEYDKLPFLA